MITAYAKAEALAREEHVPVLIHVTELTQPIGHSTSGSHQRYKSKERLEWEKEYDCNRQFKHWLIDKNIATESELSKIEADCKKEAKEAKALAWKAYQVPILEKRKGLEETLLRVLQESANDANIKLVVKELRSIAEPTYKDLLQIGRKTQRILGRLGHKVGALSQWVASLQEELRPKYSSHLYSASKFQLEKIPTTPIRYADKPEKVDGRIVIRDNFDALLSKDDRLVIFGEDVGVIGDVNQGLEGMQEKHGKDRVFDTGIREATIIGQGIGMALRGLRPIAEIQYLDYILYCLNTLSDDLASYLYRTVGQQSVPLIIRTRGHRLEGIWHSGSPMGGILHLLRGINIAVPRNMTQAAGFYNTLLQADEPALVIESLNGYRLKEDLPSNLGEFCLPLGEIEVLKEGTDITLVSYGSTLRLVEEAARELALQGISAEVIDIQTLIPFDQSQQLKESIAKTNRVLIIDEDVPGGASAYILQQLLDVQDIFPLLDHAPQTLTAQAHRPAYGSDGDYFSKPSVDDIFEKAYAIMHESNPSRFPAL